MVRNKKYQKSNLSSEQNISLTKTRKSMKWYVAKIVMQCKVGKKDSGPWTFDEQIRIIQAPDNETAYLKALNLGKEEEQKYKNIKGEVVHWIFCGLSDLEEILADKIEDGTDITSTLYESNQLLELIREKEDLTVFWSERNKDKTAEELLTEKKEGQ
ncbi:MAG: DUF4288 domain-containing protein [bacterium]